MSLLRCFTENLKFDIIITRITRLARKVNEAQDSYKKCFQKIS